MKTILGIVFALMLFAGSAQTVNENSTQEQILTKLEAISMSSSKDVARYYLIAKNKESKPFSLSQEQVSYFKDLVLTSLASLEKMEYSDEEAKERIDMVILYSFIFKNA